MGFNSGEVDDDDQWWFADPSPQLNPGLGIVRPIGLVRGALLVINLCVGEREREGGVCGLGIVRLIRLVCGALRLIRLVCGALTAGDDHTRSLAHTYIHTHTRAR